MASQAEVDLVISTAGALPELERDLNRIIRTAENGAPELDVQASLEVQNTITQLSTQLDSVIRNVDATDPTIDVQGLLNQAQTLNNLRQDIESVTRRAQQGADPVQLQAELNQAAVLRQVRFRLDNIVRAAERSADPIELDVEVDQNRARNLIRRLGQIGSSAVSAAGSLASLGLQVGSVGVAIGALVPILASVTAALGQLAPAAAVAVSGMLAVQLAAGATKLAMVGVEEAVEAAFDPDIKPEELEKALGRLAPEARKFVVELRSMRGQLRRVQQEVQNRFFQDFDSVLRGLSRSTLPVLRTGLNRAADSLNAMVRGAADAANELARDGTLGKAVDGAAKGLENLEKIPAQIVKSLGQLAAASAPALDKLTRRIDTAATSLADRITKAFDSGDLEREIDKAISTIGQLFRSVGNILSGIGNIFGGLTQDGRGLFDILEDLTEAFEELTASEDFQIILDELAKTADELVAQALPLLKEAFIALAPALQEILPVVREFIKEIGPKLLPLIKEMGPVLLDIARIMKEQLPTAILLASAVIRILTLGFQLLHKILDGFVIPAVRNVTKVINSDLFQALDFGSLAVGIFTGDTEREFREWAPSLGGFIHQVRDIIRGWAEELGGRILNSIQSFVDRVARRFFRLVAEIQGALQALPGKMVEIGRNIVQGLINGITSSVSGLLSIVNGIADRITSTLEGALDIGSPSKVMARIGEDTTEGLIVGMRRMIPELEAASSDLAGVIAPSFALPNGQSLSLAMPATRAPAVNVFIGNEQLNTRIDTRINANNRARDRVLSQGVRR